VRTPDGYRFGLQFKDSSDAHHQVGEFLESLGNKKSEIVVTAMIEYIKAHPEVLNKDNPVKIIAAFGYSEETLRAEIEALLHKIASANAPSTDKNSVGTIPDCDTTAALDTLLNALDQFK